MNEQRAEPKVVFTSPHEVVVQKPAGMAVELTSDPHGTSLLSWARRLSPRARLPHRIDRLTRGFVVIALTDESIAFHNQEIAAGAWGKWYLARLFAPPDPDRLVGAHKAYLKETGSRTEIVRAGGRPSFLDVLAWAWAQRTEPRTPRRQIHVIIRLRTGRRHQIRVMMAAAGAPLTGDPLYGSPSADTSFAEVPYLEHVVLRFRPFGAEDPITLFDPLDSEREAIDPSLAERLAEIAGDA